MNKKVQIPGGATLWARQTIESDIFADKPDKWFKIWFYLVNRTSHKNTKKYKRGECFLLQDWIKEATGATSDQVKKCLSYLRKHFMISTRRSTRGTWLKVLKYDYFQCLDNYYYNIKAPDEALEKHDRSTTEARRYNKNDKNGKNDKKDIYKVYNFFIKSFKKNPKTYKLSPNRKIKISSRLKDAGMDLLLRAITNTSKSTFHCGDNDSGWRADLDWIIKSYEQVEKLANMEIKSPKSEEYAEWDLQGRRIK